jgi:tRNA A37 N6-isopentenylltransferase MiaA
MIEAGWASEVRALRERGYGAARAMSSVGYRQVATALGREPPQLTAADADEIRRKTRVFARRQRTWLRDAPVRWLTPEEAARVTLAELLPR